MSLTFPLTNLSPSPGVLNNLSFNNCSSELIMNISLYSTTESEAVILFGYRKELNPVVQNLTLIKLNCLYHFSVTNNLTLNLTSFY